MSFPRLSNSGQIPVKLAQEWVDVDDWQLSVLVSELTAGELDEYRQPMYQMDENNKFKINLAGQALRMCVYAMRDENGNRIYPDVAAGMDELGLKGAAGVEQVSKVANRLNRQTDEKAVEGNSEGATTAASPSASLVTLA